MGAKGRYLARMRRVLDHIDRHLDGDCGLDALSAVAAFSKHHFHRQFAGTFGLPAHRYVQLARLKRASYRLAFRRMGVTEAALEAGYDAPDAFARAFRRRLGQRPSAFRRSPDWGAWHTAMGPLREARRMTTSYTPDQVTIIEQPPIPVAMMTHHGPLAGLHDTIRRFIDWRQRAGLPPRVSDTWNVFPSDHRTTAPEDFRLDLCAATDRPVEPNADGVTQGLIPGGRRAVLRVTGEDLEPAALFLYRDWLPASGERPGDFPLHARRLSFFPDVPEHEATTELHLLLR